MANDVKPDKTVEKSAMMKKVKSRVPHAEMAKLEVLGDQKPLEEREIEYMPPPAKGDSLHKHSFLYISNVDRYA